MATSLSKERGLTVSLFPLQDVIDFLSSEHTEGMLKGYSELSGSHVKTLYMDIDIGIDICIEIVG